MIGPMTGYDLLKQVRADPNLRHDTFIMVTAESKTENVIAAKQAGVNNYIVKPFNAETLKSKIEAVFGAVVRDPFIWPLNYHADRRVTAFGAMPASAKIRFSAANSGRAGRPIPRRGCRRSRTGSRCRTRWRR